MRSRPSQVATGASDRTQAHPMFAQPEPTADPTVFKVKHVPDTAAYAQIDQLNKLHKIHPLPFPAPRGGVEPRLTLQHVFGDDGAAIARIQAGGKIVFHAGGDCGSTVGPRTENLVTDKLLTDFVGEAPPDTPQFNFLLGDIVYSFGELQYYYDQFYEPYRLYPAPILGVPGNHDGMVSPLAHAQSLEGYLRNSAPIRSSFGRKRAASRGPRKFSRAYSIRSKRRSCESSRFTATRSKTRDTSRAPTSETRSSSSCARRLPASNRITSRGR